MAKGTSQDGRSQRSTIGLESLQNLPGIDPATFAASLEQFFQAGTKILDSWKVVSEELLEFSKSRLNHSIESSRKVTESTSLDQAIEAQAEYCRSALQDYIAQSGKLAELGTRAMVESLSAWQIEKRPAQRAAQTEVETSEAITTKRSVAAE
jgi:hypothetical protein